MLAFSLRHCGREMCIWREPSAEDLLCPIDAVVCLHYAAVGPVVC